MVRRQDLFQFTADQGLGAAATVADLMGASLGWSESRKRGELTRYEAMVSASRRCLGASAAPSPGFSPEFERLAGGAVLARSRANEASDGVVCHVKRAE